MIWSSNSSGSIKARIIGISPADKKAEVPLQFSLATDRKQENRVHDEEIVTVIWWTFKSLEFSEYEGEYWLRKSFNLTLTSQEHWDIILGCGINNLWLTVLNSILSADNLDELRLSLYSKEGKDGKVYPNIALNTSLTEIGPETLLGRSMPYEEQQWFIDVTERKGKPNEVDKDRLFEEFKSRWEWKSDAPAKEEEEDPDALPFN